MKTTRVLLAALFLTFSLTAQAAQTARARLFCLSLRVSPGSNGIGGSLTLTTINGTPNGELEPDATDHSSHMILTVLGSPIDGPMHVDLPTPIDGNGDGFDDFFDVAQAVDVTFTTGHYSTFLSDGTISARWSRAAGSKTGTCVFSLEDDDFGNLGDFTHTFEIMDYSGTLSYTPGTNAVTGSLSLTRAEEASATFQGPVHFIKSETAPEDQLELQAGEWTNDLAQTWSFVSHIYSRDSVLKTNYYGYIYFADGDLNTGASDYQLWVLSIDDLNDQDGDGIPDFSDTPGGITLRPPVLGLKRDQAGFALSISGEVGRVHHVLECTNLTSGIWRTNSSVTLATDPQTVVLPTPPGAQTYWRVLVE